MIGRRAGHFEILEKIGEGGMGIVYKARDLDLGRLVALKVLPSSADSERRQRFVREAQSASALNHPNIVTVHEIFREDGSEFIAMELVQGKTLDQAMEGKAMRLPEALKIGAQVAAALADAHAAGIVHRDLKPSNVMVTGDGHVKVVDFGLAKLTEQDVAATDTALTATVPVTGKGTVLGTVAYMSPEQAEGKAVDWRSDIFSFGALLYEMVTGRRAFQAESRLITLAAVMESEPEAISECAPAVPRELQRLIARCLRKKANERTQSMLDVMHALEELRAELDSGQLSGTVPAALPHKPAWWPAALAATLLIAAAVLFVSSRWNRSSTAAVYKPIPLTSYPGRERSPALSPDGKQVAFEWDGPEQNNFDIYVRLVGAGEPLRLTSDPAIDTHPSCHRMASSLRSIASIKTQP